MDEEEETFLLIRDFTIDVKIIYAVNTTITDYIYSINKEAVKFSEKEITELLKESAIDVLVNYFNSFSIFPSDGEYIANDFNAPLVFLRRLIDGQEKHIVFVCLVSEEPTNKSKLYAFRHEN